MKKHIVYLSGIVAITFVLSASRNVSAQVSEGQRAVLAFDLYMNRLATSDLATSTGMDNPRDVLGPAAGNTNDPIQPAELRRLFGAISAPPNLAAAQQVGQSNEAMPFSFFARIQFKDAATADKSFAEMTKGCETTSLGGKEFYRPPASNRTPGNIAFHKLSGDIVEIGTDDYLILADRNVFTPTLLDAWKKMPTAAVRVALDLDGARGLIDEAMQMSAGNVSPMVQPALSMVNNMSAMRIAFDLSSENMLWLTATGRDASATGQINATLGGLLAMGKGFGQQSLPMAGPDAQGPGGEILAALETKVDGEDVNIVLPRPEGFEEAIAGAVTQMMSMGAQMGAAPQVAPGMIDPNADPFGDAPAGPGAKADPFGGDAEMPAADDPFGGDGGADPFGN